MKYVLFYETAPDAAPKIPIFYPAHSARCREFQTRGALLMTGPFSNPIEEGAMSVFATRRDAEEFVEGDPFVLNGVVSRWYVREWKEALTSDAGETPRPAHAG